MQLGYKFGAVFPNDLEPLAAPAQNCGKVVARNLTSLPELATPTT